MIDILAYTLADLPATERERLTVYCLSAIVGLLITGLILCAKDMRREAADRKLQTMREAEIAAYRLRGYVRKHARPLSYSRR